MNELRASVECNPVGPAELGLGEFSAESCACEILGRGVHPLV